MGAIVLDASKVNSYVLPNLVKSKNTMQDAYSTSVNFKNSLPGSFGYRSLANDIVNQLYNIKMEISDINSIISKKVDKAKSIESESDNRASKISSMVSKIGAVGGTISGTVIGAATGGVVGAVVGGVVGNKVGSTVAKGLVNTGAKIVNGATKVAKSIWDGIKSFGASIWDGCKKVAKTVDSFVKNAVPGLVKFVENVWEGLKWVRKQIVRTRASIINVCVSLVEGLVSFVEAIGDLALLVVGGVCSIFTAVSDIITGCITGDWSWSATNAVWKKWIVPWVGYDLTSAAFDALYTTPGYKFIEDQAYAPFKRDGGVVYDIGKSVGYYTGMIIASTLTAGAAGYGSALASGATATANTIMNVSTASVMAAGSMGKNSQKQFNSILKTAKNENREISSGEIFKSLGIAGGKAVIDGATWYFGTSYGGKLAGKLGGTKVGNVLSKVPVLKHLNNKNGMTYALKATKGYVSEGFNSITTGEKYDFKNATIDAASIIIAENASGLVFKGFNHNGKEITVGKKLQLNVNKNNINLKEKVPIIKDVQSSDLDALKAVANQEVVEVEKKAIGKLMKEAVKQGINKGEEKTVKLVSSTIFETAIPQ